MPAGDGTGPMGMGPMTGGGRGFCVALVSDIRPRPLGRRFFGRGGGRGHRNMYYTTGLPGWARAGYGSPSFGMGYTLLSFSRHNIKHNNVFRVLKPVEPTEKEQSKK